MSVRMMTLVWELDLPPGEKLVLLALADQGNDEGTQCWPSVETIAHRSGQGSRTVRRCLASLEEAGHLTRDHRDGASTQYRIHPCQNGTPAKMAPLPKTTKTPAKMAAKPLRTIKASEAKASKATRVKFPAPPGVSNEQWKAFKAQRKKPLNARSYLLICNKLAEFAGEGWPPGELIDLATERGWESVFKPFAGKQGSTAKRYVSDSGYEYRGDEKAVMREAERRADWGTYWKVKGELERAA